MGERKSTIARLENGIMSYCMAAKCQAHAVYKVETPKSGVGARGGATMTRYLCNACADRFREKFPLTKVISPKPDTSDDSEE